MKKQFTKHSIRLACCCLFAVLSMIVKAQTFVNKSWVKTTGLPDAVNWTGSCFDSDKNLIFVGNTVTSLGNANILVTKYRSDGGIAWQRVAGGLAGLNDYGVAVTVDNQNNSYVAAAMTASNGLFDFAVLKYDAQGTLQWTATWDGANHLHDIPTAITLDDADNIIVAGSSISFTQQSNYAVVKYNNAGTQLWATTYDYAGFHDFPTAIVKASNDNIAVTGASASAPNSWDYATLLVNGSTGQVQTVQRVTVPEIGLDQALAVARDAQNNLYITGYNEKLGNKNIQTVKLNPNFGLEWVRTFDAEGMEDVAKAIGCDANGNVYLAGYSTTIQDGETFRILKYNASGDELWNRTYKPYTHDGARAADIKVMPTGDIYVSGTTAKNGSKDFVTLKYNSEGEIVWEKQFDGLQTDEVTTMNADENGNVYVSGISSNTNGKEYTTVKYTHFKGSEDIVYRADGRPSHIAQELIVKFKPSEVNHSFVNDDDWVYGNAEAILSDFAITQLESILSFPLRNNDQVTFSKIFTDLKTTDTISISRFGEPVRIPPFWSAFTMHLPVYTDLNAVKTQLKRLFPLVEYCHVNALCQKSNIPNDRFIGGSDPKQSSLVPIGTNTDAHINADAAWDISVGIPSINVGIYDEPIYWKHIDFGGSSFQSSVIKGGKDFYNQLPIDGAYNRLPADNHGTAVAGIIGAMRNNSTGIAGIAGGDMNPNIPFAQRKPGVSLYSLGIFSGNRLAGIGTAANAIRYGVDSLQLHIQNHSWNSTYDSLEVLKYATLYAYKKGCVMVASRGNNGSDEVAYPACFRDNWVLNVGASGTDGKFKTVNNGRDRTLQSQFGNNVDILAPGSIDNVYTLATPPTTGQNNYTEFNATSAAAAHVSGSAALLLSLHNTTPPNVLNYPNNLSPDDVEFLLQKYSKPITGTGVVYDCDPSGNPILTAPRTVSFNARPNEYNGWGLLDIGNTLRMIKAPKYHVLHPNQLATTNQTFQTIRNNTIRLLTSIGTLAAGVYDSVEIRQVGETYQHDYRNTRWKVINAWQRVGSSQGYEFQDSLYDEPYIDAFQANITPDGKQVSIQAEAFFYKIGTTWIPCDPNTPRKFRYSLHLEDATVGTKEVNTQMSSVNIYPNPTTGTLSIAYQLVNTPTLMKVEVFDITGRLIYTQEMPPLQNSVFSFEVNDFTTGAYMLCLTVDGTKSYHKIIKF